MTQPHELADAETFLIHVLTTATPPRDPAKYEITEAAEDFHAQHGSYDVRGAGAEAAIELLSRHAKR